MADFDGREHYHEAAFRNLSDARELLQLPTSSPNASGALTRHLRGAVYLAGYAAECALKEYIISREPVAESLSGVVRRRRARNESTPDLISAAGHNLAILLTFSGLESELDLDQARKKDWALCLRWKSTWRYAPRLRDVEFAREFVGAVERIHQWVGRRV